MNQYTGVSVGNRSWPYLGGTATWGQDVVWRTAERSHSSFTDMSDGDAIRAPLTRAQVVGSALVEIESVTEYTQNSDDWAPISPNVARDAQALILRLSKVLGHQGIDLLAPHVSSDGDGGITFEWWRGIYSLALFARADESIGLLLAWGADIDEEMESVEQPSDMELTEYWNRLLKNE